MIGDLYNANNVVVGQAAVFFAPAGTPLPSLDKWDTTDPFNAGFLLSNTLTPGSATSITLSVTANGSTQTTSSLTVSGLTASAVQTALAALSNVGSGNVTVTGTGTGPYTVVFHNNAEGAVLSVTPTGGTATVTAPLWTPCGATDQGWQFGADKSTQTINIEEQSTPVGTTLTSQAVSLQGALSEDITKTLALALNATAAKVAATSTTPGYDQIALTDVPIYYSVVAVTTNAEGFGRIIYAPKWTQLNNVSTAFRRAADKRSYAVQFATVCKTSDIEVLNFTSPHS